MQSYQEVYAPELKSILYLALKIMDANFQNRNTCFVAKKSSSKSCRSGTTKLEALSSIYQVLNPDYDPQKVQNPECLHVNTISPDPHVNGALV